MRALGVPYGRNPPHLSEKEAAGAREHAAINAWVKASGFISRHAPEEKAILARELAATRGWELKVRELVKSDGRGQPEVIYKTQYQWRLLAHLELTASLLLAQKSNLKDTVESANGRLGREVATIFRVLGMRELAKSMRQAVQNMSVVSFGFPELDEWAMIVAVSSPTQVNALLPEETQYRFLAWVETLPRTRRAKVSVRIDARPNSLSVQVDDMGDDARELEAWCDFCAALGRG